MLVAHAGGSEAPFADRGTRTTNYRRVLAVIMPLLIVGWIGFPRFAKSDIKLIATASGLCSVGLPCCGASIPLRQRSDFGMKTYLGAIGDDVDLIIEIEAKKKS